MSLFIKGPFSARPVSAPKGTQFWDMNSNITYTYGEFGWEEPKKEHTKPVEVIEEHIDIEEPIVVEEKKPATKAKKAKATK